MWKNVSMTYYHALISSILLGITIFTTGCVRLGVYNDTLKSIQGTKADKISVSTTSSIHSIQLDMIGGSIEDGYIIFEHVTYTQSNPFWSTKVSVENYTRPLTRPTTTEHESTK